MPWPDVSLFFAHGLEPRRMPVLLSPKMMLANSQREGFAREVGFDIAGSTRWLAHPRRNGMKIASLILSVYLGTCSCALAQSSGGSSAGSSAGGGGTAAGSSLSNGSTLSGTGGSSGPNTSKALNHGTTGNNLRAPQTNTAPAAGSRSNAVDTPSANSATQSISNTDTGILKK